MYYFYYLKHAVNMNRINWIIIFMALLSTANAQTKDREYYLDISKALGYSYGIELTNNLIQEKFSDLSKKALMAELTLEAYNVIFKDNFLLKHPNPYQNSVT